jgi:hypothetical protein
MKRALVRVLASCLAYSLASCLASACSGHGPVAKAADPRASGTPPRAATAPAAPRVPDGFVPMSATFVSDRLGWVLGSVPCPEAEDGCDVVAVTRDGGRSWQPLAQPRVTGRGNDLRFANERDGFLVTGGLEVTHDGGRTWQYVDTLRDAIHEAWSAEAARGQLWLTGRVDHGTRGLWVGSVRRASFDFAPVDLPDGDADDLLLSLHGPAVVLAYLDRGAPRVLVSENGDLFVPRDLPCAPTGQLALRSTRAFLLVCGRDAYLTADAGRTWRALTEAPAAGSPLVTPGSFFVAGEKGLFASRDEGRSWERVLDVRVSTAGFESPRLGFVIDDHGVMHLSRDDGATWERVDFRRTG